MQKVKVDQLEVESGYNARSEKEVKDNAKELVKVIEASGGFDEAQPVTYVIRGKKKLIRRGHTRLEAAKLLGVNEIPALQVSDDALKQTLDLITSNEGVNLTQYQKGSVYVRLRDGGDPQGAEVGTEILAPMPVAEIAKAVGKSRQHIDACIAIFEAPEAVGAMVASGALSPNVATRAMQLIKDAPKLERACKAAISAAKEDGKETATMKHFDAIKDGYIEAKKVAAKKEESAPEKTDPEEGKIIDADGAFNQASESSKASIVNTQRDPEESQGEQDMLLNPSEEIIDKLIANINATVSTYNIGIDETDIRRIAENIIAGNLPF